MDTTLLAQAKHSDILSKELISFLLETMDYSSAGFVNEAIDILKVLRIRIDRGDKITDAVSGIVYDKKSFKAFVQEHFSQYIFDQVFIPMKRGEKIYFRLEKCEEGYELVLNSADNKVYRWISSLNEKFSLVYMIVTKVVYLKNIRTNNYSPFISENGKYCRYDESTGKIIEITE